MRHSIIQMCILAIVGIVPVAEAQDHNDYHTDVWSLYVQGGMSWVGGVEMKNVSATGGTNISPLVGLGVNYHIRPWVRVGLNYDFTKYAREQRFGEFQVLPAPMPSNPLVGNLEEQSGGVAYRNLWSHFHDVDLTAEFNIMEIWKNRKCRQFQLYVGVGVGGMFAKGNGYELSMGYNHWSDADMTAGGIGNNHEMTAWQKAHNSRHHYNAFYIPVSLAAEYEFTPQVAVGLKAGYKILCSCADYAPGSVGTLALTVRYSFVGRKGYKTPRRQLAELTDRYAALSHDCDRLLENCREQHATAARTVDTQADEIQALKDANARLKDVDDENGRLKAALAATARRGSDIDVQFRFNSAVLTQKQQGRLMRYLETISPDAVFTVIGEANDEGDSDWNYRLSERRMQYVVRLLNSLGVDSSRIKSTKAIGNSAQIKDPIARRVMILAE